MKSLFITTLALLAFEANASILCHTPRMNKIFEIKNEKVTFFNEFDHSAKRELASVNSQSQKTLKGFTNTVSFENHQHVIHIADTASLSDLNDYVIIKGKNGHEVTYPLTCTRK